VSNVSAQRETLDYETLAFAQRVFDHARFGNAGELEPLLVAGLPPNLRNDKGDTLLMLASYHGRHETARVLMEHGADPELANDRGQTPLAAAAYQGNAEMVRLLLELGAAVNGAGPGGGRR
jgi:ankyrin repeat protein